MKETLRKACQLGHRDGGREGRKDSRREARRRCRGQRGTSVTDTQGRRLWKRLGKQQEAQGPEEKSWEQAQARDISNCIAFFYKEILYLSI